jgi:hypothetical protein
MHYAIAFPQRKRDPARGNEDRADDVTALQRGAHKVSFRQSCVIAKLCFRRVSDSS